MCGHFINKHYHVPKRAKIIVHISDVELPESVRIWKDCYYWGYTLTPKEHMYTALRLLLSNLNGWVYVQVEIK